MAMDCDGKTLAVVDESGWVTVWNIEVNNQLLYSLKLQVVHSSMSSLKKISRKRSLQQFVQRRRRF